jgi:ABC-2 type transport system ATP-binding protein/lipopolysaccharide transport system ATP-binding protein
MARVHLSNVEFSYPIFQIAGRSLKVAAFRGRAGSVIQVHAIRNVSLDLEDGDRLGLIGSNGSGKSTLLRLIGGLAHPQSGQLAVEGRVVNLIERGVGINPELSGDANIELPLRLLGATDSEIVRARTWVPEFTGLGDFIHLPVRTYSDGMKARLTFALSTAIAADVLVLDEWLSAGDVKFVDKAQAQLTDLVSEARIIVMASHSFELVKKVCNKVLWMQQGKIVRLGPATEVVEEYLAFMRKPDAVEQAS